MKVDGAKSVRGDWWPNRDIVCHRVSYNFDGALLAIRRCKKFDLVIQAGGNVGVWPRFLKTVFREVVTFEPSEENYRLMVRNLEGAEIVHYHAALGAKEGFCAMKQNPKNCGDDQTIPGEGVGVMAIDSLGLAPDLIYLDIQGDELPALQGAVETIYAHSPVIALEYDPKLARRHGDPRKLLQDWGYRQVASYRQDLIFER